MEKKVEQLTQELKKSRESQLNGRVETQQISGKFNALNSKTHQGIGSKQYIDLKQIKKIEPKRPDKSSTKGNNKYAPNDYIRADNLNAKTAEIMRASPGVANNYQNQTFTNNLTSNMGNINTRPLMNVNINSNKAVNDEMSNYEKNLFRNNNQNSSKCGYNMNNSLNNPVYQNEKRNYQQMTKYDRIMGNENYNNSNQNFQTPGPNNSMNNNEIMRTKKFKYN